MLQRAIIVSLLLTSLVGCGAPPQRQMAQGGLSGGGTIGAGTGTGENTVDPADGNESNQPTTSGYVDSEVSLAPYKQDFLSDAVLYGATIPEDRLAKLQSLSYTNEFEGELQIGVCSINRYTGDRLIKILSPSLWPALPTQEQFRATVYHELGHCLLEVNHYTGNGISIMQAYLLTEKELASVAWSKLVSDLFNKVGIPDIDDLNLRLHLAEDEWLDIPAMQDASY